MNLRLKIALLELGITQKQLSKKTRIPECNLSMAINEKYILGDKQKRRISKVLGKPIKELFND